MDGADCCTGLYLVTVDGYIRLKVPPMEEQIIFQTNAILLLVLKLSLPPIIVATVVGVLISLLQALTQVQDQTLGFAAKLIAVTATLYFLGAVGGSELYNYTLRLFDTFPMLTR